ncbi:MAG: arylsulfatase [Verrucomicrobiae bacterium]|nr:arylsulfatase [Verrucomicrobiae bacterium]
MKSQFGGRKISMDGTNPVFQYRQLMNVWLPRFKLTGRLALVVALIPLALIAAPEAEPMPPPAPRRPSIILIMADDLGYGDLGCYGQTKIQTPNLDKLAREGIRFSNAYAGSTVCAPSRAALMLGDHTGHLNIRGNAAITTLQPNELTLAEMLKTAGYKTALIGKWGLTAKDQPGVPQKKGFQEFLGYLDNMEAHDYYPEWIWRYDPPRPGHGGFDGLRRNRENSGGQRNLYLPDLFTKAALNFLSINKPTAFNRYQPFFLFLSYNLPHANNEEGQRTGNGMQVPSDAPYSSETWPAPEKNKAAMITRLDAYVGQIMDQLVRLQMDTNTVVIFTSDNGPHAEGGVKVDFFKSARNLRGYKRDLYEGGIRVPAIVRWPFRTRPNQVNDLVWANWDWLATFADLALTKPPTNTDSISIYPTLVGQPQTNKHDFLYWEFHERGFQQAARTGDWKAVRPQADEPLELYNLASDPRERLNLASQHPEIIAKFETYFKTARTESPAWPIKPKPPEKKEGNAK